MLYEPNLLGSKGPRKMRVILPALDPETGAQVEWRPLQKCDRIVKRSEGDAPEGLMKFINKEPWWS